MHAIFTKAHQGLNTIIIFLILMGVLSIAARLIVRRMLVNSEKTSQAKKAFEKLTMVLVIGILGMIMISVLGQMK